MAGGNDQVGNGAQSWQGKVIVLGQLSFVQFGYFWSSK